MEYPVKGFLETSFSDWPGKVVAVLFLPSCNLRCLYCHNHELVLRPENLPDYPLSVILEKIRGRRGWIDGICISGGEPTIHTWLPDLIETLRTSPGLAPRGSPLGIKLDTNGTRPDVLRNLIANRSVDYVAMDLKAPLDVRSYSAVTGTILTSEYLERIETSIEILLSADVGREFRTTLAPAFLTESEILTLARRVAGAERYTLQNLNPQNTLDTRIRSLKPWDDQELTRIKKKVNEIIKNEVASCVLRVTG
jgi:pyruvate formate lyase activating enzyme